MGKLHRIFMFGQVAATSVAVVMALAGCAANLDSEDDAVSGDRTLDALSQLPKYPHKALCEHTNTPGQMHCHARVRTDAQGIVPHVAGPTGLNPADLRSAYKIP